MINVPCEVWFRADSERIPQKNFEKMLGNYKSESTGKLKFTYEESDLQGKGLMM
ncbi:MAG: hypothetical protein SGJ04_05840 [Bacteroidota bacterium]|nr:hypothetical protein [Bacteroidota bacterium]